MSTATGWTHMNAWLELPRKSNWYQMLKGDSNEWFKQRTGVGCNRISRKTCRKQFKKDRSKLLGTVSKKGESGRARRSLWSVPLYRSQSKSLIDAAKRNGVNHIVHLGVFSREHDAYATVFAWHQMIEAYLRDSGVAS